MWTAKVEAMVETGDKRLWKVVCYMDEESMGNHKENLTYDEAVKIAKELQESFDGN